MHKIIGALGALAIFLSSCAQDDKNTLYLFNWTYYTPDSVIRQFEQEYGVTVRVDSFASNEEMFAKLKAGADGYDIVVPSQDYVSIMIKEDMLAEIDHSSFPNGQYISRLVLDKADYDPLMRYSVPYFMGAAGIAVNTTKIQDYPRDWSIFADKRLANHMSMLDDMREVIGDALAWQGKSVNSLNEADLQAAKDLIIREWKPNLVKFDAEGFGKSFASGDFWAVQGYSEVVFGEVPEDRWDTIDFFIPEKGGPMYIDSMCILKNARHYDLAMKFINFIHRPEIYAQFLDTFHFPASVNMAAAEYMTVEPVYQPGALENCEIKADLGEGLALFNSVWQDIRFTE